MTAAAGSGGGPRLLLRETVGSRRWLTIVVGAPEARALLAAYEGRPEGRPSTIGLFAEVLRALRRNLVRVEVTEIRGNTFIAEMVFGDGVRVSARPSDAVAVALRVRPTAPVLVRDSVLEAAGTECGLTWDPVTCEPVSDVHSDPTGELSQFRAFLDVVSPEDFDDAGI